MLTVKISFHHTPRGVHTPPRHRPVISELIISLALLSLAKPADRMAMGIPPSPRMATPLAPSFFHNVSLQRRRLTPVWEVEMRVGVGHSLNAEYCLIHLEPTL